MNGNVFDVLKERGFIKQTIYEDELYEKLGSESVPFYIGFDPTADSLHIGHYIPIMAMAWMQKFGHKPIALFGGGTGMIGDPSGRSDMRQMMTVETINHNIECFKNQMSRFIKFDGDNAAVIANNADWLLNLNYVNFLRDIGAYFSVNKMLTAECFKQRMEKGLTFLEFNYMLMQGYDFLHLFKEYGCVLEVGGDDQWSNMLAGVDLIRRKEKKSAFCLTCTLLLNSEGKKMGKTQKGALWLDENKCSVYDFYQYFRNVEDVKVEECMRLLTFMDMDEIRELTKYNDERMNVAKERLAFEVTKLVHGEEKALSAQKQARAAFGGGSLEDMPTATIDSSITLLADVLVAVGQAKSKGEAKRLIEGGGVSIEDKKITDPFGAIPQEY
ncbi:MAG: tyrosine--tRNA ligase, partial [Clostridia bacterium]|nr:tyrosine--tRNA ligase [Clostridia bacterium]